MEASLMRASREFFAVFKCGHQTELKEIIHLVLETEPGESSRVRGLVVAGGQLCFADSLSYFLGYAMSKADAEETFGVSLP